MNEVSGKSSEPNTSCSVPNRLGTMAALAQRRNGILLKILAFAILVISPIALQIWIVLPEINRRAPYEDWDEICGYNHSRPMSRLSWQRVPSYGSLDTCKFIIARQWHQVFDRKAQSLQEPLWTNGVPDSFRDYKLLTGPNTWSGFSATDYNYARGICDRSVIITTRKVGFIVTYAILGLMAAVIVYTHGFSGIAILMAAECYLFSHEFQWYVVRALPGAQTALLEGFIFIVLLIGLHKQSPKFLQLATVLCAISTNFKVDSLIMAVPITVSYLFLHLNLSGRIQPKKITVQAIQAVGLFMSTLLLTNTELLLRPILTTKMQIALLSSVGHGSVDLRWNWNLFKLFLNADLAPLLSHSASAGSPLGCIVLLVGLTVTGFCFVLARSVSLKIRASMIAVTIVTLLTLWGIPIIHLPILYGRYLTTGLLVFFLAFGYAACLFIVSQAAWRSSSMFVVTALLPLTIIFLHARSAISTAHEFRTQLSLNLGLDSSMSRNKAILEIWRLVQSGEYDNHVLIDQHSYTDIRFLYDRGLSPLMINAWNYKEVFASMQKTQKPVLGLYVPGSYDDKSVPRWVGIWSPADQEKYDEYIRTISSFRRMYGFEGTKMRLLDWSPVLENNSVYVFKIDPPAYGKVN